MESKFERTGTVSFPILSKCFLLILLILPPITMALSDTILAGIDKNEESIHNLIKPNQYRRGKLNSMPSLIHHSEEEYEREGRKILIIVKNT